MELFNAKEGLKDFDPTLNKTYCGPGEEYNIGCQFGKLESTIKSKFENDTNFLIGQFVKTNVQIGEADSVDIPSQTLPPIPMKPCQ